MTLLERHGVSVYWLVDSERPDIEVYTLVGRRYHPHSIALRRQFGDVAVAPASVA
jgi:Uma2 family endonuclease